MQYMDCSCWESTEFRHDLGIQPKKAWSEAFHTRWIGSEGSCYHWYIRPSSYILTPFSHFWGKEGGGRVLFVFCFAHGLPVAVPHQYCWQKVAEFGGRYWYYIYPGGKRGERKNSTRLFERSPSSYICTYHTHLAMIKRKRVVLNCRRVPPQIHEQQHLTSPHRVFPFPCCYLIQELG